MINHFFPLQYFRIQNRTKFWIDLLPPVILAAIFWWLLKVTDPINFFGPSGIITNLMALTGTLTGFYIAALTAAASFNNPDLDDPIKYGALSLDGNNLSRRQWICYIFGYLSFSALVFTLLAAISIPISIASGVSDGMEWFRKGAHDWLSPALRFACLWWIAHMFVVTMLGLQYLVGRMDDRTPQVTSKKAVPKD